MNKLIIGIIVIELYVTNIAYATPILCSPWKSGEYWEVTYGSSYHVGNEVHALDFNRRTSHCTAWSDDYGEPVLSAHNGTVVFSGWKNGFGNTVEVSDKNEPEFITRYAHFSSEPIVDVGDEVMYGSKLGYVGHSGGTSTSDHLHFVLLKNGQSVKINTLSGQEISDDSTCIESINPLPSIICGEPSCNIDSQTFSNGDIVGWYPQGNCDEATRWFGLTKVDGNYIPSSSLQPGDVCICR